MVFRAVVVDTLVVLVMLWSYRVSVVLALRVLKFSGCYFVGLGLLWWLKSIVVV